VRRLLLLTALLAAGSVPSAVATTSGEDRKAILEFDFACDEGSTEKLERWGRQGYSRGCYRDGVAQGKTIYWEEGYLNLEGFFSQGKKHGLWTVYNTDGSVFVTITFDEGVKTGKHYSGSSPR